MTDKQFTAILSPVQKLSNLSASVEEKVTMLYEISVESIRYNENQASELKTQTSILKDIRNLLSGGASGSKSKAKKEKEVKGPKPSSFAGLDKLNKDTIGIAALAMVGIAAAIVAAAGIFTFIPTVSGAQLLTALAISVAFIPMSYAFVQIASVLSKVKGGDKAKNAKGVGLNGQGVFMLMGSSLLAMVGMSAAVAMSSWVMQLIVPVSIAQVGTAFFIGLAMVGLAYGYAQVVKALASVKEKKSGKINSGDVFSMVGGALLSMVGMAAAVTMSSKIMQYIVPVKMEQIGTAFFIGLAMVGMSYGYAEVVRALAKVKEKKTGKINTKDLFSMIGGALLSMVGMAGAVTLSSKIMQYIVPIKMEQAKTAFFIGLAMVGMAYGYAQVVKALAGVKEKKTGKINTKDLFSMIGGALLSMIGMAGAITLSSKIMQYIVPVSMDKLGTAFAIGIVMIGAAFAYSLIAKNTKKLKFKDILMATAAIPLIAIGLTAAAWIFTFLPETFNAPPWKWSLKSGLALAVFGIAFVIMAKTVAKLPLKDLLMGVVGMAAVAVGILAVAWIFSILPDTFTEVPMGWVLGSVVALVGFGVVVGIIGAIIMATGGTGLAAIALGVVGMIIIAAGILAVAWILSYIPADKLSAVAKGLTEALLAPINGIVDVLARLKNEIGVDNLIPLAGGIIAISASLIALSAATASVAAGGLFSSIANVGESFFGAVSEFFGGERKKGPMEILSELVTMSPQIKVLSTAMTAVSGSFVSVVGALTEDKLSRLVRGVSALILKDETMSDFNGYSVKDYFTAYPAFLNNVAKGYMAISNAQAGMDIQVLDKTTEMIKALAYLNSVGGDNAMAQLGESLVSAVKELSDMISKFGGSVDTQTEAGRETTSALNSVVSSLKGAIGIGGGGGSSSNQTTMNFDTTEIVDAIEELQLIIKRQGQFS